MDKTRVFARSLLAATVLAAVPAFVAMPAAHGTVNTGTPAAAPTAGPTLLAKAAPDECFVGIGLPYPPGPPCEDGKPKVNQSYVWGLTKSGDRVWFGTGPNVHCLTSGLNLAQSAPVQNEDYVCEYGESQLRKKNPALPAAAGDWRPPKAYLYHTRSGQLTDKTGDINKASSTDRRRWNSTVGIRAAGSHKGVVLLGGPGLLGINLFAFDSESGRYLGSRTLAAYGNIRHFVVADGALYAGVGLGPNGAAGGAVLRWAGDRSNPFNFTLVGNLAGQVADLAVHKGRIFVSTWTSAARGSRGRSAGVWMSPRLAHGRPGLTIADVNAWKPVWSVANYEPDPVVASTYGLGGLASYGGHLYWGTMHVPLKATQAHTRRYAPANDQQALIAVRNTQRTASIFRASNFDKGKPSVELLYGASQLPAFDPKANNGAGEWRLTPTGYTPKFGAAGFGNGYNNYTWKMVVAGGKLYVGTMDWSYLLKNLGPGIQGGTQAALGPVNPASYGADLWAFDKPNGPAKPVSTTGLGNYLNYGIRNMVADGSALYLGMANPMNLRTDKGDDVPEGGWELIRLPVARW